MAAKARQTAATPPARLDGSAGIYLFFGQELFLRRLHLHELVAATVGADADASMAVSDFDGAEVGLAAVLDELRTLPFLAQRRVVIVHDADAFVSEHRDALERYLEQPCQTGVLALLVDQRQANSNLYKAVATRGGAVACDRLAQSQLAGWIQARARDAHGKAIDLATASLLADLIGDDLGRLDGELGKLASYLGDARKTISPDDVDELVANRRLHDAFELTGAIAAKKTADALTRWNDMIGKDPDASFRSVGLIAWQVRQLLRARLMRKQGLTRDQVFQKLRLPYFVRDQFAEQVNRFSDARLRVLLRELVNVDLAAKTGGAPATRGIEQFIVKTCQA